jgi:hypothetical protein
VAGALEAGTVDWTWESAVCVFVVGVATATVDNDITVPDEEAVSSVSPPTSGSHAPSPIGRPSCARTVGRVLR